MRTAVYKIEPESLFDNRYTALACVNPEVPGLSDMLFAVNLRDPNWQAPRLTNVTSPYPVRIDVRRPLKSDYPCIDLTVPAFSGRAVEALRDLVQPCGELLPLTCEAGRFYAFNPTIVSHALDLSRSTIEWDPWDRVKSQSCWKKLTGRAARRGRDAA